MFEDLEERVTHDTSLRNGYHLREGFIFMLGGKPGVYDAIVIRNPADASAVGLRQGISDRTLEEHIAVVGECALKKAVIVCDDLAFLRRCPSLEDVRIVPSDGAGGGFDYSPLYEMPNLRKVHCCTLYGPREEWKTTVDYRKIPGVTDIGADGPGHHGYEEIAQLERLWLTGDKTHRDCRNLSCSDRLKELRLQMCSVRTLEGLEQHQNLKEVHLYHNRSLTDLSALPDTLECLTVEGCGKVRDFSVLYRLKKLKHLNLYGSAVLPSLEFLKEMKELETFVFTMDVADGDLSPCMELPYASCKNRRHFNFKDAQLPKW